MSPGCLRLGRKGPPLPDGPAALELGPDLTILLQRAFRVVAEQREGPDVTEGRGSRGLDIRYSSNGGKADSYELRVWELPSNCLLKQVTLSVNPWLGLAPAHCTLDDQAGELRCSRPEGTVAEYVTVDLVNPGKSRRGLLFDGGRLRLESSPDGRQARLEGSRELKQLPNVFCRIGPGLFPLVACPALVERQVAQPDR